MNQPQQQRGQQSQSSKSYKDQAKDWISQKDVEGRLRKAFGSDANAAQELVSLAQEVGHASYEHGLTSNQIRNIFGMVKRWEMQYRSESTQKVQQESQLQQELTMLRPKIIYAASRHDELGTWIFALTMLHALDQTLNSGDLRHGFCRFVDLFEAILAFHKEAEAESRKRRSKGGY